MYSPTNSVKEIAKALAKQIKAELADAEVSDGRYKTRLIKQLFDKPPKRHQLSYQQEAGMARPKRLLRNTISNQPDERQIQRFFCLAHGEFVPGAAMDIEHAYPHQRIRDNQARLIAFLNAPEQKELTTAFLAQPGIKAYFRCGPDKQIKGSGYFYQLCYNVINNLFLLCHACNLNKSTQNPLDWFKEQEDYFGRAFIEDVEKAGGLHEGVLLSRIYCSSSDNPQLKLSEHDSIELSCENGQGLGEFAREWFFNRFQAIFERHRDFYNHNFIPLKEHLETIQRFINNNQLSKAKKAHQRLLGELTMLKQIQEALVGANIKETSSGSSASSSDDAEGQAKGQEYLFEEVLNAKKTKAALDKLRRLIKTAYDDSKKGDSIRQLCWNLNRKVSHLSGDDWEAIYSTLEDDILAKKETRESLPTISQLKVRVTELHAQYSPLAKELAKEKARADEEAAARQKEAAARQKEVVARQKEAAARQSAEAEVKALKKQLGLIEQSRQISPSSDQRIGLFSNKRSRSENEKDNFSLNEKNKDKLQKRLRYSSPGNKKE